MANTFVPFRSGDQLERLNTRQMTLDSFLGRLQSNIRTGAAAIEARINALFGPCQICQTVRGTAGQVVKDIVTSPQAIVKRAGKIASSGGNVVTSFVGGIGRTVKDTARSLNRTIIIVFVATAVIIVLGLVLVKRT